MRVDETTLVTLGRKMESWFRLSIQMKLLSLSNHMAHCFELLQPSLQPSTAVSWRIMQVWISIAFCYCIIRKYLEEELVSPLNLVNSSLFPEFGLVEVFYWKISGRDSKIPWNWWIFYYITARNCVNYTGLPNVRRNVLIVPVTLN